MGARIFAALFLLVCRSFAADSEVAGPVLGFVHDPANGLQPLLGMAGASTVGPPLDLASEFSTVVVSPRQDYALAVSAANPNLLRVLMADPVSVEQLGVPIPANSVIALSPAGSAAAFFDRDRNRIYVVGGMPSAPSLTREFDLSTFSGELASLTVSDDASIVIAGFSGVEDNATAAFGSEGTVRFLDAPRRATAAAFLPGRRDAVIADRQANEVYLVRDPAGSAESTLLAGANQEISEPLAVSVSRDGKRAFVASGGARRVSLIDLGSGAVTSLACGCGPSALAAMSGNAVFRLTAPGAGPIWLLDADASEPRIVFVPPYRPVVEESVQ